MTVLDFQSPSSPPLKPLWLEEDWYVRHSTRALWHGKRNVIINGSHSQRSPPSGTLLYSYQEQADLEVKTRAEVGWKILGQGKDGKLEGWMRVTEWGIEDSSGEARADWRAQWIVIYFPPTTLPLEAAGIDILCSLQEGVTDGTLKEISDAFDNLSSQCEDLGQAKILHVLGDGARHKEMQMKNEYRYKKWEKRTGPEEGISPDLVYDDTPKDSSSCTVQ